MGNFTPFVFIQEKEAKRFLQNVQQSNTPICMWTSDLKLFKANDSCKRFFDIDAVKNISQLEPKEQPYFSLSNTEAAKLILKKVMGGNSEKKSFFWLFQNKDQEIWTKIYVKLLKVVDQLVCQVFLKKSKIPNSCLNKDSSNSLVMQPRKIEKKLFPKSYPNNSSLKKESDQNNKLIKKFQVKYEESLTKLQQQIDENDEFKSLLNEIIRERNKLLMSNAKNENPEKIEEYIYDYQSELLDAKYQLIINQIKKIKIIQNFNKIKKKTLDIQKIIEAFENKFSNNSISQTVEKKKPKINEKIEGHQENEKKNQKEEKKDQKQEQEQTQEKTQEKTQEQEQEKEQERKQKHEQKKNQEKQEKQIKQNDKKKEPKKTLQNLTLKNTVDGEDYSYYFESTQFNLGSSSEEEEKKVFEKSESENTFSHVGSTDSLTESGSNDIYLFPLSTILSNEKFYKYFMRYLIQISCSENLRFYLEVNNYKKLNEKKFSQRAKKICKNFITPGSYSQINISSKVSLKIRNSVQKKQFTIDLFDKAQEEIYLLMKADSYLSFVSSPIYDELSKSIDRHKRKQLKIEHVKQIVNKFDLLKISQNLNQNRHFKKKYKLNLLWKENGAPQIQVAIKNKKHLINFDVDSCKLLGGKQTAPNSISIFLHSIISGFIQYFLYHLTKNKLAVNEILVEAICQLNYKTYFVQLQTGENYFPININIIMKSNSSRNKIMDIYKKCKKNCPILNYIKHTNNIDIEMKYKNDLTKQKMKKNPKIVNNLQLNKVKKFKDKLIKKKHTEIQNNIVFGKWNVNLKQTQAQCRGIIQLANNTEDILTTTLPRSWGGKNNNLNYVQFLLAGVGTNYLTQLALQSSLHNVPVKDLSVNIGVEKNWENFFTSPSENQNISNSEIFRSLKITSNLKSFVHQSLIDKIEDITKKTCPALCLITNKNTINFDIKIEKYNKRTDSSFYNKGDILRTIL
ncbi:regulator of g protein signaling [Anaeramoeba flamelloides]|uniref:Regulator of g protein signaling n=1 Tax=Anaeramoeba flamelloides TaxID=1746091 RepID=A0ABQ8YZG4_9EUKA|nr:regulator of g protein signaling [Anaeramoeba flamelloides]